MKKQWKQPGNAKELASQVNQVATMLLNDEIDGDRAAKYSALVRTVAQALSIEMQRARLAKSEPDLTLENMKVKPCPLRDA